MVFRVPACLLLVEITGQSYRLTGAGSNEDHVLVFLTRLALPVRVKFAGRGQKKR